MITLKFYFFIICAVLKNGNAAVIPESSSSPWVVIVGSGPSGIAAATRLYEGGITNITILEAENRIGGRVFTTPFANTVVDMGAQWCHGQENNVVYNMVKDLDVLSDSDLMNVQLIDSSGHVIDPVIAARLQEVYDNLTVNSDPELLNYTKSLGHFFTEKFYRTIRNDDILSGIDSDLAKQYLELFEKYENSMEASDNWWETSALGYVEYLECPGSQGLNWKNRGYKTILDVLLKKFPDSKKALPIDDKFILNKEVININWGESGKIQVTTSDNSIYDPDYVIFTSSLGVLKERHETLFTPTLPPSKINAIKHLEFGTVDKIYLHFDDPWWPEDWHGFNLIWTEKDKEAYQGNRSWLIDIFGFYRVDFKPQIITGWLSGPSARYMEKLTTEEVKQEAMDLIKHFLINSSFNITDPSAITKSSWFTNPHFRGSYSYRSLTSDRVGAFAAHIAEPLTKSNNLQGLLFAGEATHSRYYSTVHGAIETGWREADRILNFRKQ